MANFILNSQTVLMCPHGGSIQHVPTTFTTYRVNGYPPLRLADSYLVTGCPFMLPMGGAPSPSPCQTVLWTAPSPYLFVKGSPVLTNASIGICTSAIGIPGGPVVIGAHQVFEREPDVPTNIND